MANLNFESLRDLHETANHLLHSPTIRKSLSSHEKFVNAASESSLAILDICSLSKDVLSLVKDQVHDLRSTLRRSSNGPNHAEDSPNSVEAAYNLIKRKLKKESAKILRSMKGEPVCFSDLVVPVDPRLGMVVEVFQEVRLAVVAVVESIEKLVSIPWLEGRSSNKGSIATKLKRLRGSEVWDRTAVRSTDKRLEAVEIVIEDLEMEAECMFRRLIQTRVSLLNILTN